MNKKEEIKLKNKVEVLLNVHSGLFKEIQNDIKFRIIELERLSNDLTEMAKLQFPVEIYDTASAVLDGMERNGIGNSYQRNMFAGFCCDIDDLTVDAEHIERYRLDELPIANMDDDKFTPKREVHLNNSTGKNKI